jgi:hypothetical protein
MHSEGLLNLDHNKPVQINVKKKMILNDFETVDKSGQTR